MSVVVAVRKEGRVVIAGDGLTTSGAHRLPPENHTVVKHRRVGKTLLGATGWTLYGNILDDYLVDKRVGTFRDEAAVLRFFVRFWRVLKDRYTLVNDQPTEDKTPFADIDAHFLLANRHGIFQVSSDLSILRCERFMAIGAGSDYALGALDALWPREDDPVVLAKAAVTTAIRYHANCGEPVTWDELE